MELGGQISEVPCIQADNYYSGLGSAHGRLCFYCEEDATHHVYWGYHCGNVCEEHAMQAQRTYGSRVDVEDRLRGLDEPKES